MYQSEFTDLNPLKKLVCSVYCEDTTTMKVLSSDEYGEGRWLEQFENLKERCQYAEDSIDIV